MSGSTPSFTPASLDSNTWYTLSDGRVRFNGALCIANETLGTVAVYSPRSDHWQFQRLSRKKPRYAIRSNQLGVRKQLAACHVPSEIDGSKTQPCLRDSDGSEEQMWDIHEWGIDSPEGNTTYRLVNVRNGTDYWLDVHPGNPPFMSSEVGSVEQRAQMFVMKEEGSIDDGAYSTTFTNLPTSSNDESTTATETSTTSSTSTSESSSNPDTDNSSSPSSSSSSNSGLSTGAQAGIGVGISLLAIIIAIIAFLLWRRRRKAKSFSAANTTTPPAENVAGYYAEAKHGQATGGQYKYDQTAVRGYGGQDGQVYHEMQGSGRPMELPGDHVQSHELMGDEGYQDRR